MGSEVEFTLIGFYQTRTALRNFNGGGLHEELRFIADEVRLAPLEGKDSAGLFLL